MPPKKAPLHETEIALIRRWIAEGAMDDTPANAKQRFDAEHPPRLSAPAGDHVARLFAGWITARRRRIS